MVSFEAQNFQEVKPNLSSVSPITQKYNVKSNLWYASFFPSHLSFNSEHFKLIRLKVLKKFCFKVYPFSGSCWWIKEINLSRQGENDWKMLSSSR